MTIATTASVVAYTCDGATTAFPVTYDFFETSELEVIERVTATGVETVKTLTTDYTVTGGDGSTGTVTAVAAPASGRTWTIRRVTAQTQSTDLQSYGPLPADSIETMVDRLTAIVQEVVRDYGRGLLVPKTETGLTLPSSVDRASKYLLFDASGNPTAAEVVTVGSLTVSAFVETLLNVASSTAFLTGLETQRIAYGGLAGGTADALTCTAPGIAAYADGISLLFVATAENTISSPTINVNGLGARTITGFRDDDMQPSDLFPNALCHLVYYGGEWRLMRHGQTAWLKQWSVDYFFSGRMNGSNPMLEFDTDDYYQYDRTNNRHEFYAGAALAPLRVGSGVATADTATMAQAWVRLESYTVAATPAQKDFVLTTYITRGFKRFRLEYRNLTPAAAAVLFARFSVDAGSTFKSAGGDYGNSFFGFSSGVTGSGGSAIGYVQLTGTDSVQATAGNASGVSGTLQWESDAATVQNAQYEAFYLKAGPALAKLQGLSNTTFAGPIDAVRIGFVAQNMQNQGSIHLFGSAA